MSKLSPLRPELITELMIVKDNSLLRIQFVKFNNGHFLHQFTYFYPVNFIILKIIKNCCSNEHW